MRAEVVGSGGLVKIIDLSKKIIKKDFFYSKIIFTFVEQTKRKYIDTKKIIKKDFFYSKIIFTFVEQIRAKVLLKNRFLFSLLLYNNNK